MELPTKVGRYEILERVGRGGMGVLYRGRDPVLDREVAIKVMLADFAEDESARPRFYREARAAAKLQHRNIVTIFEFGEEDQAPYIVMEFLRGQDLLRRMRADPPLTLAEKLDIVADLCTGLHYAHQEGVVHRDVKPGNIWLLPDGTVKLLDFGIAKIESSHITRAGSIVGTAGYMAPEQVVGESSDGRADIFSAGVVLYELLSGRKPFEAATPTAILARILHDQPDPIERFVPELPPALVATLTHVLERDPANRFQLAGGFASELRAIRASLTSDGSTVIAADATVVRPIVTPPPPPPQQNTPVPFYLDWRQWLRPPLVYVGGAAAFLLLLVLVMSLSGSGKSRPPSDTTASAASSGQSIAPSHPPHPDAAAAPAPPAATKTPAVNAAVNAGPAPKDGADTATPSAVAVSLHGSFDFEVYDGSQLLSQAATEHELTVKGRRVLRLRSDDYLLDRTVSIDPAARRRYDISLEEPGYLTLKWSNENCSARIGRVDLGFPPVINHHIAAGTYRVTFTCPDAPGNHVDVTVEPGGHQVKEVSKW